MGHRVVVLSGRIASGKSTLAQGLQLAAHAELFRTQDLLRESLGADASREAMQREGARLDAESDGQWVAARLASRLDAAADGLFVVDAVRQPSQVEAVRSRFGGAVTHVHLLAPLSELEGRFALRPAHAGEATCYGAAAADPIEAKVDSLADVADIVIDTARSTDQDVLTRTLARLDLHARVQALVDVLVGGELGSEGKGHISAHLAPEYDLLVRGGGPNAGHTVMSGGDRATFHHIPSGARANPEAHLLLGPGAVVRVPALLAEIERFGIDASRLSIDPQVMTIDDDDIEAETLGLRARIGSTAQGVGYATARRVRRDESVLLASSYLSLAPFIRPARDILGAAFRQGRRILLEGTQGSGLSLFHGPYPYVTSRDTTAAGCIAEAGIAPSRVRRIIMVCRTYPIRVAGASGPMSREITWTTVSDRSGIPLAELEAAEKTSTTKRDRRVGEFDWAMFQRSVELNGPTDIALTFADYLSIANRDARRFEQLTDETLGLVEELEVVARAPVSLISTRFEEFRSIIDRRRW